MKYLTTVQAQQKQLVLKRKSLLTSSPPRPLHQSRPRDQIYRGQWSPSLEVGGGEAWSVMLLHYEYCPPALVTPPPPPPPQHNYFPIIPLTSHLTQHLDCNAIMSTSEIEINTTHPPLSSAGVEPRDSKLYKYPLNIKIFIYNFLFNFKF